MTLHDQLDRSAEPPVTRLDGEQETTSTTHDEATARRLAADSLAAYLREQLRRAAERKAEIDAAYTPHR